MYPKRVGKIRLQKGKAYKILNDVSGFINGLPYTIHAGTLTFIGPSKVRNRLWNLFRKSLWGVFILDNIQEVVILFEALEGKIEEVSQ